MIHKEEFSPWYDANKEKVLTGIVHNWQEYEGTYYGPTHKCTKCGEKNVGWNLWKEDFMEDCNGQETYS